MTSSWRATSKHEPPFAALFVFLTMTTNNPSLSGGPNDNPWESLQLNDRRTENLAEERTSSCNMRLLRVMIQLSLFLDTLLGISLIVYYQWLNNIYDSVPTPFKSTIIVWGSLLACRAMLGWVGMARTPFQRLGLWSAGHLCLPISLFYVVISIQSWIERSLVRKLLTEDWMFPSFSAPLLTYVSKHYHYIWMILLGCAVLECSHWQLYQYHYTNIVYDDDEDFRVTATPTPRSRRSTRPWWWSRTPQDELTESLLSPGVPRWVSNGMNQSYEESFGMSPAPRQRRRRRQWFSWARSDPENNLRDDGSVDFASVQEEWASRTEEDPLWWSREENESNIPTPIKQNTSEPDTSWANETNV